MGKVRILYNYIKCKYFLKFKNRKEFDIWQKTKIKKHLKKVSSISEFYKGKNSLDSFPIITKKEFMDNFNSINTKKIKQKDALNVALDSENSRNFKEKIKDISVGLSSGTSGNRGLFLVSDFERDQWTGYILSKVLNSIFETHRIAFFLRANNNLYETIGSKRLNFKFFDLKENTQSLLEKLEEYNPTILVAPPTMLKIILDTRTKINPKKIVSVAEVLEHPLKNNLKDYFKSELIEIYQATEGLIGISCKKGKIHLNEDIMLVEKDFIDKKRFFPIITDFNRKTQPMIRYKLNDILIKGQCDCGNIFTCIDKIEGRSDDILIFKNKIIFPDFIIRTIINSNPEISEFRVTQKSNNDILVELDNLDFKYSVEKNLINLFNDYDLKPILKFTLFRHDKINKKRRVINGSTNFYNIT